MVDVVFTPPLPTGWDDAKLNEQFAKLAAEAEMAAVQYLNQHTPSYLQPYLKEYMDAMIGGGGTKAVVNNGDTLPVSNVGNANVTMTVAGGAITDVVLATPATTAYISNGDLVPVHNLDGSTATGSPGVAGVAAGGLTQVTLSV